MSSKYLRVGQDREESHQATQKTLAFPQFNAVDRAKTGGAGQVPWSDNSNKQLRIHPKTVTLNKECMLVVYSESRVKSIKGSQMSKMLSFGSKRSRQGNSLSSGSSAFASSWIWYKNELSSRLYINGSDSHKDYTSWSTNCARNTPPYTSRRRYTSGWRPINRVLSLREDFIDCKSNKKSGVNWSLIGNRLCWAAPKSTHITARSSSWKASMASWKFLRNIESSREKKMQRRSRS